MIYYIFQINIQKYVDKNIGYTGIDFPILWIPNATLRAGSGQAQPGVGE